MRSITKMGPFFALAPMVLLGCGQAPLDKIERTSHSGQSAISACFEPGDESGDGALQSFQGPPPKSTHPESRKNGSMTSADKVTGVGRIYERNPNHRLVDKELRLLGDGTLTSSNFITVTDPEERALETTHQFIYEPNDPRFRETSLFVNATKMLDWFVSLGFNPQSEQIGLGVNAVLNGSVNNALYTPGAGKELMPTIRIGNGDGVVLQNLSVDADVVSHSLGHHVIFRKLKETDGESMVVHEALADSFVMLHNDDPCVGASICPAGSTACWVQNQCLRTADNDLTLDDPRLPTDGLRHLHGQVISGMLWDLRRSGQIENSELSRLVFDAVDYLKKDSGIKDLINALLNSDDQNYGGIHKELIRKAAMDRHLI